MLKNTLARRVFADLGMDGLSQYLTGPRRPPGAARGSPSWPRRSRSQVKTLKKPEIKGGAVDGVVVGPEQVEDITKLPSREVLIGQVLTLLLGPAREALALVGSPASTLIGQLEAFVEKQQGRAAASAGTPPARPTRRRAAAG